MANKTDYARKCQQLDVLINLLEGENKRLREMIVYCKDCEKHNKVHGFSRDGEYIGVMDCCPLTGIRGKAQGHEFDYQFCVYGKRRATT